MSSGQFRLSVRTEGRARRVTLYGELDISGVEEVVAVHRALVEGDVVVDLSWVSFIDASGIGALIRAKELTERRGGEFRVRGAEGLVKRVFELSNAIKLLED